MFDSPPRHTDRELIKKHPAYRGMFFYENNFFNLFFKIKDDATFGGVQSFNNERMFATNG